MSNVEKIAQISISNARNCLTAQNYGRAFANFLLFLKLKSENAADVYQEFALASKEWFEQLEQENRLEDLFKGYDQACELYPNHDVVLNNIGAQLFRLGYIQEAAAYIRKSLMISPHNLAARDNLENICSHLVERWHFAMLNDKKRNMSYRFAIQKAVKSGYSTVLDIGTGTGILSLMCHSAGAQQITACDGSRAMYDVAFDVLGANGAQEEITLLHKHSTALTVPDDLPSRVKLVVTETFDAGLFGEHIVSTMIHAWKNLISTSPTGTVIPCGATVYVCGIECEAIRSKSRLLFPVLQHLDLSGVSMFSCVGRVAEEPYTTENLARIPGGYRILTNIAELLRVSFCNLCELESFNKGRDWVQELFVRKPGRVDALAVWFDLHLDDTITIATAADSQSCWEQAIFPVSARNGDTNKFHVKRKDRLQTTFHFELDCFLLTKCDILCAERPNVISQPIINIPCATSPEKESRELHGENDHNEHARSQKGHSDLDFDCQSSGAVSSHRYSPASVGSSVKECSQQTLPFRKRKVSEEEMREFCTTSGMNCDISTSKTDHCHQAEELTSFSVGAGHTTVNVCADELSEGTVNDSSVTYNTADETSMCDIGEQQVSTDISSDMEGADMLFDMSKCSIDPATAAAEQLVKDRASNRKMTCVTDSVEIQYINDIHLNSQYCRALQRALSQIQSSPSSNNPSILYITPRLSFLGIQAAKMGFKSVTMATSDEHFDALHQVAALNGCQSGVITLLEMSDLSDLDLKADIVFSEVVDPCGALRQQALEDHVYHIITNLAPNGHVFPGHLRVQGLFIESQELECLSHVTGDEATLDYQIAEFINVFQMQNHLNIDLTTLNYSKLTEVIELASLDFANITIETGPEILDLNVERSTEVIANGKISALVYWFEIILDKDTVVNTLDSRHHWKQAAIMIRDTFHVGQGQTLVTKVMMQNSCLDVKVLTPECVNGH
ncbi:protein arginine N-methyltransferase 9-like [Dreissena polymorpha]|uniref:Protein arginine N-methyltransferase domain-containing protein n=1 Tax=Dreissena polymorpha TaxID=45954 RepID=A0A9D4QRD9_DREPO|nr:protein arginine N-methyltransferase 9-like [Dreissena polymorpha]KAH3840796.1 hypothetical protein DPMN_114252 [Dreissena polymorpha]